MSNRQIKVNVHRVVNEGSDPAAITLGLDDEGYIVMSVPAPGSCKLDPETESPDLREQLILLEMLAQRRRARRDQR
ncbi:MAG TPA: hypothetical protein VGX25_03255 [Actinophytocola sp.]|uniref:hypothetical protein n=1 Tax=Actinophytocola sp. TaxID=1872138 RepID=UPI002DDCCE82|nr:hypothetical protein [Actinophytocola sp.]HEV2778396.1 hypothetical protein [Actinophytocola sp.]